MELSELLEILISESIEIIIKSMNENPFKDLEKSLKIVQSRNYNQYKLVRYKIGDVIMMIYNNRFSDMDDVLMRLNKAYSLLEGNVPYAT